MKISRMAGKQFLLTDDDGITAAHGADVAEYITTLLWADDDGWGDTVTLSDELISDIVADVKEWLRRLEIVVGKEAAVALQLPSTKRGKGAMMHDLVLTRGGHGAGFWDGDWPEVYEDRLTRLAEGMGQHDIYKGDDGLLYGMVSGETGSFCKKCGGVAMGSVPVLNVKGARICAECQEVTK